MPVARALLVLVGGTTTLFMIATNTVDQGRAPDDVRGRVLSVWSMSATDVMPLGDLTSRVACVIIAGAGIALLAA